MIKIVITGATGYIGTRLAALATRRGYAVVSASRQHHASCTASWIDFDLASNEAVVLPEGTDVVVHLAANTVATNPLDDPDVTAAQGLIKSAQNAGARFIFISSQTARADAPTPYGRTKWRIEQEVLAAGGWVAAGAGVWRRTARAVRYAGNGRAEIAVVACVHAFPQGAADPCG